MADLTPTPNPPGHSPRRRRGAIAIALVVMGIGLLAILIRPTGDRSAKHIAAAAESCRQSEAACRAGNYREALTQADSAIVAAPEHAPGYARRARAKYFLGDEDGALADCDEAIRRDPGLAIAYAYRAPVAWLHDTPSAGIRDGERALESAADSVEFMTCLALARLQAGEPTEARKLADKALELDATDPETYRVRGLALAALGVEKARDDFDSAGRLANDRPFYRVARANYLLGRAITADRGVGEQLLIQASNEAKAALATDPDCAMAHLVLANVNAHRGRRFDVIAACEKAVASNPNLVAAYLRAAEDLSPRELKRYQALQEALAGDLDLREFKGGDFAFGALVTDLQRLASNRMKQSVPVYINYLSFPPEIRGVLRDLKVNLNSLMDCSGENLLKAINFRTILETLCRQVGARFWVGPEHIEIVHRDTAAQEATRQPRIRAYELIAPIKLYEREGRILQFEQALQQTIDLRELKGGDFAFGALLPDLQRLISSAMHTDIPIYINIITFDPEPRQIIRDAKVSLNVLMDVSGENLLESVKGWKILDQVVRCLEFDAKVRITPDYIEIVGSSTFDDWDVTGEVKRPPPRLKGRPRPEAIQWLTRGIEQVPTSGQLYRVRGEIHLDQFELDVAIEDLTAAIVRNPGDREAYRLRSLAYAARGKPEDGPLARRDAMATGP